MRTESASDHSCPKYVVLLYSLLTLPLQAARRVAPRASSAAPAAAVTAGSVPPTEEFYEVHFVQYSLIAANAPALSLRT